MKKTMIFQIYKIGNFYSIEPMNQVFLKYGKSSILPSKLHEAMKEISTNIEDIFNAETLFEIK